VEARSAAYLARHGGPPMLVGAALFDRARRLRVCGPRGAELLEAFRRPA
jgi:cobalt-precorrin-5B (C1)-methyltransferase